MKTNNTIFKLLAITILCLVANINAYALDTTDTKRAWVFGYNIGDINLPDGFTADDVIWINQDQEVENPNYPSSGDATYFRIQNIPPSINISNGETRSGYGLEDYSLHSRSYLEIKTSEGGTLIFKAKGSNGYKNQEKWQDRTINLTVTPNGTTTGATEAIASNKSDALGEITRTVASASTIRLYGNKSGWIRYYYIVWIPESEPMPAEVQKTWIGAVGNKPLSTLEGTAMGLTTTNTVKAGEYITTYSGSTVVRPSGNQTITSPNNTITLENTQTSQYNMTCANTINNGQLSIAWVPWDDTFGSNMVSLDSFNGTGTKNGTEITISDVNTLSSSFSGGKNLYYTDGNDNRVDFKYFMIELSQPTPSGVSDPQVVVTAEYTNGKSNSMVIDKGAKVLYVPLDSKKLLQSITLKTTGGQVTLTGAKNIGFSKADYIPAFGELNNIVVEEGTTLKHLNQTNSVYYRSDNSPVTNTQVIDGRTYYKVTYGDEIAVAPTFTLDDQTVVEGLLYDCSEVDVDPKSYNEDGDPINQQLMDIGSNSNNRGYLYLYRTGTAYVSISLKDRYGDTYSNRTSQRTYFIIEAATPVIGTNIGNPVSGYSGTGLGLYTNNSVDLNEKFRVFLNGVDVTGQGTLSYTVENLTLDGSTVSSTTALTNGKITVTWTPTEEGATKFNSVTTTVENIQVTDHRGITIMTINPDNMTVGEGGYKRISDFTVTVKKDDTTLENTGLTYVSADPDIAEYEYDSTANAYVIKGYKAGTTTITVTYPQNGDYQQCSATITVTVKQRIALAISPKNATVKQGEQLQFTCTVYNDKNNNGQQDSGEATITTMTPEWSTNDFLKDKGTNETYTAYIRLSDNGLVTALNPGYGPGVEDGDAMVKVTIPNTTEHTSAEAEVSVKVVDNTLFDYMGWDLKGGHEGHLYNPDDADQHYLHWRFAAPEGDDVYVFRYQSPEYKFVPEILSLNTNIQKSEKSIDNFYETKLTDTKRTYIDGDQTIQKDAKGDAFLEYNGMIAGYGTERGGRYMSPISGTFVRIEAEYDGVVTIRLRHNGSTDGSNVKDLTEKQNNKDVKVGYQNVTQARRALFVIDENGVVMPRTTNYATIDNYDDDEIGVTGYVNALKAIDGTYARISEKSIINDRFDIVNDAYTAWFANSSNYSSGTYTASNGTKYKIGSGNNQNFSKNAFHFIRKVIYGYEDSKAADFNAEIRSGQKQKLFYSATDDDVKYQAPGVSDMTYFFSKYGYEVLGATHLMISFPVKAGKTYFVGANKSKVGLCSVEFLPDENYGKKSNPVTKETLYEDATAANEKNKWLLTTDDQAHLNVTLDREFVAYRWHPLVLPFSVSETQLKHIFGDNVAVIALDGGMKMMSSMNNYATRDCSGTFNDYSTKSIATSTGNSMMFNGHQIKKEAIRAGSVTFTRHYYQMIYANCPVFLWTDRNIAKGDVTFENVTFQKFTLDKQDAKDTPAINDDYTVTFPYAIDRQIGNGAEYNYVMKASYVMTKPSNEIYYVNNIGTGNKTTAYLYHALKGQAPTMKGTRVWIEPAGTRAQAPLRTISMEHFYGEEFGNGADESGICDIIAEQPNEAQWNDETVYDVMGRVVGYGSLDGLRPGIYIFKGTKCYIK